MFQSAKSCWSALPAKFRWAGCSLALLTLAFLAWNSFWRERINEESYARIRLGMRLAQVERIIGRRAGDYQTRRTGFPADPSLREGDVAGQLLRWYSNDGMLNVYLGQDESVGGKTFMRGWEVDAPPSLAVRVDEMLRVIPFVEELGLVHQKVRE